MYNLILRDPNKISYATNFMPKNARKVLYDNLKRKKTYSTVQVLI